MLAGVDAPRNSAQAVTRRWPLSRGTGHMWAKNALSTAVPPQPCRVA